MASKEREMDLKLDPSIDSQVILTLRKGADFPEITVTKVGRMSAQMIFGIQGSGIMSLEEAIHRARLNLPAATSIEGDNHVVA